VWLVAAVFTLGVSLFVQLVILQCVFPSWADPSGLLAGHDSIRFHEVAAEQALRINAEGWSAWELRPNRWGISGLMSIWYALFGPVPASWAIVQATIYGLSVALLFAIMIRISGDRGLAVFSVIPALLLPSTAVLYVFPHRDVFVFLGLMLAIYGLVRIATLDSLSNKGRLVWLGGGVSLVMAGFYIAGSVRVFTAELFLGATGLVGVVLLVKWLICFILKKRIRIVHAIGPAAMLALIVFMSMAGKGNHFDAELRPNDASLGVATDAFFEAYRTRTASGEHVSPEISAPRGDGWRQSVWVPEIIDDKFRRLSGARDRFLRLSGHGRSLVDGDINFRATQEILAYLPRASQIGLFSPFPEHWKPHPNAPTSRNLERGVVGVEMIFLYFLLPFALFTVWWRRRETALWVALLPAMGWVVVYATTVPVIGALVRYRYGAYLLIIAVAMVGLGEVMRRFRGRSGNSLGL
jgi:hypothetical protein